MDYYPGIQHFKLAKPMPGHDIGTIINICQADGRESLWVNTGGEGSLEMHIDTARLNPEWFTPVTVDEYREICEENLIEYYMSKNNSTREKAIELIDFIDKAAEKAAEKFSK